MAPAVVEPETTNALPIHTKQQFPQPVKASGALSDHESRDITPAIGREFPKAKLVDWLNAPNTDELIRDLAVTISERGVVFFRAQDDLTDELQKELILRLGKLTGRPATSSLHIHPILNSERELGGSDLEISTINSVQHSKFYKKNLRDTASPKKQKTAEWHSDIAFEPVPADYTSLRLTQLPTTGGDTLWASGYEIYDRLSEPYQKFLESLTVTFEQPGFGRIAQNGGFDVYDKPRGSPENIGKELKAIHPLVRTNPVTGWKSVFPVGSHVSHVNDVTDQESKRLLDWFLDLVYHNHDLQVRFKWENPNDIAIWDNRSVFHTATYDYGGLGDRHGNRVVGIGERPYLDPNSTSRRTALERKQ